jgi:hypothetical protein
MVVEITIIIGIAILLERLFDEELKLCCLVTFIDNSLFYLRNKVNITSQINTSS